jgi:hypothetical protein
MNKLLIIPLLLLGAYFGWSQWSTIHRLPSRPPTPQEERNLVGTYGLVDSFHPSWNISVVTAATHTVNHTNSIIIVRSPTVDAVNHIILPDCTNNPGRYIRVITAGPRNLAVLTNANSQSIESFTNTVTTAGYSISSNVCVEVVSTGTNWFVVRVATGNN